MGKPSKYKNVKTEVDGMVFDSKGEAGRWRELVFLERAGEIQDLTRQARLPLHVNGQRVCDMILDFRYTKGGEDVWEDFKGMKPTPVWNLKKKMAKAEYGIEVIISGPGGLRRKRRKVRAKGAGR